jgi:exonuclease III
MSILSWNCRGLGNPRVVRDLHHMVKEKKPTMVFIMETKVHDKNLDFLRINLGMHNMFVVDSVGKSKGLILLWRDNFRVEIQNYSRQHINVIICTKENSLVWKFTGFYGHPEVAKRREAWGLLRHLSILSPLPWICMGDFNEIVCFGEQRWAVSKTRR